jgi:3-phenylpropionate/trans-cinnamate dioxygenase ferredoxin reductase component
MSHYKYLILGGGMTADAAVSGIRELDSQGNIAIICEEDVPPYNRPPLSKGLWKGKPLEKIWRNAAAINAEIILGSKAISIDSEAKRVVDDQGSVYTYEKLLIATGGTPRRLPFGGDGIIYFRTLNDYQKLHQFSGQGKHVAVIGGGFIGSEIAAALAMNNNQVTMVFPEEGIGARVFPREISLFLNDYYRSKGVEVLSGINVTDIQDLVGIYSVVTDKGPGIQAACVVAGIGIIPNTDLASKAGIFIKNGIIVDANLRTNQLDIYSAGDVAEFLLSGEEKPHRLEHEDNANSMGLQAGRNMAGAMENYEHHSFFYSDLFDLGYEAIGELDSRLETFIDWQDPFKKGVIYYLDSGRVRGVLLWNVWNALDKAGELLKETGTFSKQSLKNRIV